MIRIIDQCWIVIDSAYWRCLSLDASTCWKEEQQERGAAETTHPIDIHRLGIHHTHPGIHPQVLIIYWITKESGKDYVCCNWSRTAADSKEELRAPLPPPSAAAAAVLAVQISTLPTEESDTNSYQYGLS